MQSRKPFYSFENEHERAYSCAQIQNNIYTREGSNAVNARLILYADYNHTVPQPNFGALLAEVMQPSDITLFEGTYDEGFRELFGAGEVPRHQLKSWDDPSLYALGILIAQRMVVVDDRLQQLRRRGWLARARDRFHGYITGKPSTEQRLQEVGQRLEAAMIEHAVDGRNQALLANTVEMLPTHGKVYVAAGAGHYYHDGYRPTKLLEALRASGLPYAIIGPISLDPPKEGAKTEYIDVIRSADRKELKGEWLEGRQAASRLPGYKELQLLLSAVSTDVV